MPYYHIAYIDSVFAQKSLNVLMASKCVSDTSHAIRSKLLSYLTL